jgi:hypothetical protein
MACFFQALESPLGKGCGPLGYGEVLTLQFSSALHDQLVV